MTTNEKLKATVEHYTGKEIKDFKVHRDPKVSDCYAILADGQGFLMTHYDAELDAETLAFSNLEECEFETWPPKSGSLKFF